jgi:hypothetical protein
LTSASRTMTFPDARTSASLSWKTLVVLLSNAGSSAPSLHSLDVVISLLQQLVRHSTSLCVITRITATLDANHCGTLGLLHVARLEQMAQRMQSAALPVGPTYAATAAVLGHSTETEVAWVGSTWHVKRLRVCTIAAVPKRSGKLVKGLYAITGGVNELSLRTAKLLIELSASHVIIASSSSRVGCDKQSHQVRPSNSIQSRSHSPISPSRHN